MAENDPKPEVPQVTPPADQAPAQAAAAAAPGAPPQPAAPKPAGPKPAAPKDEKIEYGFLPMAEEMDSAKWKLPPLTILLVGVGIVIVVGLIFGWFFRYEPVASGQMRDVFCVEMADQANVLCTVQITVRNDLTKPLYVHTLKGTLQTADGKSYEDDPASEVDYERYFQAFPALREHANAALKPETKIVAGQQVFGTLVFGFPVPKSQVDSRTNLLVTVQPYDNRAIVVAEKEKK